MDAQTIDQACRGDRLSQGQILRAMQDRWFRFCLALLRDTDRARDATQETAVRFLQRLPNWRGDGSVETWSFGIALNVVREMRRAEAGRRRQDARESCSTAGSEMAATPGQALEAIEGAQLLRDALDLLPERQREAVILRFFEALTTEQTAAAMHCAPGTVKATLHQALRSLKQKLRQLA